jgi:hypothetical protein
MIKKISSNQFYLVLGYRGLEYGVKNAKLTPQLELELADAGEN